jgi:hypothetical protein
VEPNLGDLKWACATVPTPQGDIEVEVENGCIKLRVPMGATAEYCGKVFSGSCFVKMKLERGK